MSDLPAEIETLRAEKEKYELAFRGERDKRIMLETKRQYERRQLDAGDEVGAYWVLPFICLMIEFIGLLAFIWHHPY